MHSQNVLRAWLAFVLINTINSHDIAATDPIVNLGYARHRGLVDPESLSPCMSIHSVLTMTGMINLLGDICISTRTYYGIRYAVAPTGDLRWRSPVPADEVRGHDLFKVINAVAPRPSCPQGFPAWLASAIPSGADSLAGLLPGADGLINDLESSEDCLRLDVVTPLRPQSARLPVVVQIHGGGYTLGNSQTPDGLGFVNFSQGGVIHVRIQYRLGAFGFLGGDAVRENGAENAGLQDQRLALKWVQKYIHRFGGDPNKVTIAGSSAGGGSVVAQLLYHGGAANPPYRGAIAEFPWGQPFHNNTFLNAQYDELLQAAGVTDLADLRALDYSSLVNATLESYTRAYDKRLYGYGDFYYGPYVDGTIIQKLPSEAFAHGSWSKVPLIVNHNFAEGPMFTNASVMTEAEADDHLATLFPASTSSFRRDLATLYPLSEFHSESFLSSPFLTSDSFATLAPVFGWEINNTVFWQLQAELGDAVINCLTYYIAKGAVTTSTPVWKFIYNSDPYIHGADMADLWGVSSQTNNSTRADILKAYVLSFVADLDPNAKSYGTPRPYFPRYSHQTAVSPSIIEINENSIERIADPDANGRCEFWQAHGSVIRN